VTDELIYMTADEEEKYNICHGDRAFGREGQYNSQEGGSQN